MAKYWDQILTILAWGTALVLFYVGVRKLFQSENSLKKRGRFALYVALALAFLGWGELRYEEPKSPTPAKVDQPSPDSIKAVKNTAEWKAFAKFWRLVAEKKGNFEDVLVSDEDYRPLQNLVDQGKLDKYSVAIIRSACDGYIRLNTIPKNTPLPTSRAMPEDQRWFLLESRNTLSAILKTYDLRGVMNDERRANLVKELQQKVQQYNAENQYLKVVGNSPVLGGGIITKEDYFKNEKDALDYFLKEKVIDADTSSKIQKELDKVDALASVTKDLLTEFFPALKETVEFKNLKQFWIQLNAVSPKPTKDDYAIIEKKAKGIMGEVNILAQKGCISSACARQMNNVINMRLYVFGEAVSGHYRLTPELDARMTKIDRYNVQLAAIFKLKRFNRIDEKALKAAKVNADKILANYLAGDMLDLYSYNTFGGKHYGKYTFEQNRRRSYQPQPDESLVAKKQPELKQQKEEEGVQQKVEGDTTLTFEEMFQDMRKTLDDLLKHKNISQDEYTKQKQKIDEAEKTFSEVSRLIQQIEE